MPLDFTPLLPAVVTFAAALVAGGIARSNLIATKETKISEFRQAWIDSLREELAGLFSNIRTLTRAVQEDRAHQSESTSKFHIASEKLTEVRHGAAETYHKIKLRLNRNQEDHNELLRLLSEMMTSQQAYLQNNEGDALVPLGHVERASDYAEVVLKSEWETVKGGEPAYKDAVKTTNAVLVGSGIVWVLLVLGVPAIGYIADVDRGVQSGSPAVQSQYPARPAPSLPTASPAAPTKSVAPAK